MLDVVMPIPLSNVALARDAIEAFAKNTDVPFKLFVMTDGGVPADFDDLISFLGGCEHPWQMLHNNPAVGLNQSIREGLEHCREKITAIIGPEVRLMDPKWFGKVQQIFHREPITGLVDTAPNTASATLYPVKRAQNRHPLPGCRFMVVQTAFAKKTLPFGDVDPANFWSRMLHTQGGAVWHAGGVRYIEVAHEEHELQVRALGARG